MILFFFLLLMLALAWGVADHYQSILRAEPSTPAPADVAQPAAKPATAIVPPPAVSAGGNTASDSETAANAQVKWPVPLDAAGNPLNSATPDD